jgi:hypothetical protein
MNAVNRRRFAAGAVVCVAGAVMAGPIDPPAGPVQDTMKSLQQVEPRIEILAVNTPGDNDATPSVCRITQPGSYYLAGHLAGEAGKITIEIACDNVSIDLGGFTVFGGLMQIAAVPAQGEVVRNISVRNGSLDGQGAQSSGIHFDLAEGARVEGVSVTGSVSGIRLGAGGLARDCSAQGCVQGFQATGPAEFVSCRAADNSDIGFLALQAGASFSGCIASGNTKSGFWVVQAVLEGCGATGNGEYGFASNTSCLFRGCRASQNAVGGFISWTAGELRECVAHDNGGVGIEVRSGAIVEDCEATRNGAHGIRAVGGCRVAGNACTHNGQDAGIIGSGILIEGAGSRVESNHAAQNEKGISTFPGAADNFITGNTAYANPSGNFSIGAGNELAPVISNPGSNNFSTATAWSNFSL